MHLLALVDSPNHVCCRYRLTAFQAILEQAGHTLALRSFPRAWWSWLRIQRLVSSADAVVVQRKLLSNWQLKLLRRATPRLLFDFDDAVYLRDSYSAKGLHSPRRFRQFANMVQHADAVIAGNAFLQQAVISHGIHLAPSPSPIHVIPTCIQPSRYPLANHQRAGEGVELVWVGSSSTLQGLEAIASWLEDVGQSWPGLRLKLICDRFLDLRHLRVVRRPWSEATESAEIASADIGISWLPDDDWSRGKCGLKVLQYMAAGLPVVANPVGVQAEMVRHGETGLLASTPGEWSMAIGRLAHDPSLRTRMGLAGRSLVERKFSVAVGADGWVKVLNGLQWGRARAG